MEDNEAVVRAALEGWNRSDQVTVRGMDAHWVAEPSITPPEGWPESGEFRGREAVIGQLSTGIAHELNQPLAAIVSYEPPKGRGRSRGPGDS